MNQEIEIEFKNLVTKDEFNQLCSSFSITTDQFVSQENHYFDTEDFALKQLKVALRIRQKNDQYILTLKQPAESGLLETHQEVTEIQAKNMINGSPIMKGDIFAIIKKTGIDPFRLRYFGTLRTNRAEVNYKAGTLVLDNSCYLNVEDYEVEYEVTDEKQGQTDFNELLTRFDIPIRETKNKIQRLYDQKLENEE